MVFCEFTVCITFHSINKFFRKYLSDPTEDVRIATETLLADFLREIRDVSIVRKRCEEKDKSRRESEPAESIRRGDTVKEKLPELTLENSERAIFIAENDDNSDHEKEVLKDEHASEIDYRDTGGKFR